ncbi:hypothetical protein HYFRA_00011164 [Hymenoscyphus fraxineus]|uniref:Uncharacterized protein n=1 Tax=Hymenoscyphus fraxineus TaxID=746836 RepID=A0A9N9L2Z5_9HELO|nr:hypothetical protein HYFRA_00011164 [Hymenoscyphus fraxineus]
MLSFTPLEGVHIPQSYQIAKVDASLLQNSPCAQEASCTDCLEHYRAFDQLTTECRLYTRSIPREEARQLVHKLVSSTARNREILIERLNSHGDIFISRWKKRSRDKRGEILSKANADLPERRCYDLYALVQSNDGQYDWRPSRTARFRTRILLPYLATSSLKENPGLLFALLHYRTKFTLADWATFDMHQVHNAWESGLVDINFSPDCIIAYGDRYGEVVPYDQEVIHRGDMIGFPRAQLLLEAQSVLMETLVRIVDLTLEGANLDTPSSSKWLAACNEGFRASGDLVQWSTYSNAPFSAPPLLDIEECITTAELRLNAVADHLALLQTDPAYTRRYIRSVQQGQAYRCMGDDSFQLVNAHISADVMNLYWWQCIKDEAEHVQQMQTRFKDQICRGSRLPPKYENALAAFELVLVNLMNVRGDLYRNEAQQRPGFEHYFKFTKLSDGELQLRLLDRNVPGKFFSDPLFWCMLNLTDRPDREFGFDHAHLFTFLDDYFSSTTSPNERGRFDQIIVDRFSDLAATHQLLQAVRLNRPQNKAGDASILFKTENRRGWDEGIFKTGVIKDDPVCGVLLEKFYDTPTPRGKRDNTWLEGLNKLHSNLAEYWKAFRPATRYYMKDPTFAQYLKADLAPGHIAELASYRQAIIDEISKPNISDQIDTFQQLDLNEHEPTHSTPTKKRKKKTRPVQEPTSSEKEKEQSNPQPQPQPQPPIPSPLPTNPPLTSKRALELFTKMYDPSPDSDSGQGCDWDQFVLALKDVGFEARSTASGAEGGSCDVEGDGEEVGEVVWVWGWGWGGGD